MWVRAARSPHPYLANKPYSAKAHRSGRLAYHQMPSCILCTSTPWLCFAKIAYPCLKGLAPHIAVAQESHRMASFCKSARQLPPAVAAPVKSRLLIAFEPLELRQRGPVTRMLVGSRAKIGFVLQVALGDAYPREIKLRSRDIAGERQALAGRILARKLPRQCLDLGCK